ncbi:MAG: methyltransferase domain-containing protein [Methanotrichaceae archaeon]|nr:methyltransferase domain-containing protein [Methanotrichaceae archaeon]
MTPDYVHGYTHREAERLRDQAETLSDLLHSDTAYPAGCLVLEAGCGVGAQTAILSLRSRSARITSIDISSDSLRQARSALFDREIGFARADVFNLPFPDEAFDHVFLCFVLEHLKDPERALVELGRVLKAGGSMTVIEGDHGSCFFHPSSAEASIAWNSLIQVQAGLGADSLIGRRLYPLLSSAGLSDVQVSPRMVYSDASRPAMMDGFVRRTIIPMVEGVKESAISLGLADEASWEAGIRDLHRTAQPPEGTFCYTFFKGVGIK